MDDRREQQANSRAIWLLCGVILAATFGACMTLLFCQAFLATK